MAGNFVTNALMKSVDVISDGHTPTITSRKPSWAYHCIDSGTKKDNIEYVINTEKNSRGLCSNAGCANEKARIKKNLKELRIKFDSDCPKL